MLDSNMQYTCAYWKEGVTNLEEAQKAKIQLIMNKLKISPNSKILDIGCGWGGLSYTIAQNNPTCEVIGISISNEQINCAKEKYKHQLNLKFMYCDYRNLPDLNIKFDRIVSIGMFEHVGSKNFDPIFNICNKIMKEDSIFLLHTITSKQVQETKEIKETDPWINKYIFPGGYIPGVDEIYSHSNVNKLMIHDTQNLSISYAKTLHEWFINFDKNWNKIKESNLELFTEKFYRMWKYYLQTCEAAFIIKDIQLTQFIITKVSYPHMYVR